MYTWIVIEISLLTTCASTDYGRPVRKSPSLQGRKSIPNPKFICTAEAYFVCYIGPKFQVSLIYAFIGCPWSVCASHQSSSDNRIYAIMTGPAFYYDRQLFVLLFTFTFFSSSFFHLFSLTYKKKEIWY